MKHRNLKKVQAPANGVTTTAQDHDQQVAHHDELHQTKELQGTEYGSSDEVSTKEDIYAEVESNELKEMCKQEEEKLMNAEDREWLLKECDAASMDMSGNVLLEELRSRIASSEGVWNGPSTKVLTVENIIASCHTIGGEDVFDNEVFA